MLERTTRIVTLGACAAALVCACASAGPTVYLNFGSVDEPSEKEDQATFADDGTTIMTMKKGPRLGFVPTDIGYDDNDDRDAIIQEIVDQIRAKFMGLNITFVTEPPAKGEFETVNFVTGGHPSFNTPANDDGISLSYNPNTRRLTINGGDLDGWYIDATTGRLHEPDGTPTDVVRPGMRSMPTKTSVLGIAQRVDGADANKSDQCWVFVGAHTGGDGDDASTENRNECSNTAAHELGHLLGLTHDDCGKGELMGETNDSNYGSSKDFSDGSNDEGQNSKRKLRAVLGPKQPVPERTRTGDAGTNDQHGTSTPSGKPTGDPKQDAADRLKEGRRYLTGHLAHEHLIDMNDVQPSTGDPPGIDVPLFFGQTVIFNLTLDPPGPIEGKLVDAWIELTIAGVHNGGPDEPTNVRVGLPTPNGEFVNALAGVDQRYMQPDGPGYAYSNTFTFFLDDYIEPELVPLVLGSGQLQFALVGGGQSPFVSVDKVRLVVVDRGAPPCPGDTNGDGVVDFVDLSAMLAAYGSCDGDPDYNAGADLDGDGCVDFDDFSEVLAHYGSVCV